MIKPSSKLKAAPAGYADPLTMENPWKLMDMWTQGSWGEEKIPIYKCPSCPSAPWKLDTLKEHIRIAHILPALEMRPELSNVSVDFDVPSSRLESPDEND